MQEPKTAAELHNRFVRAKTLHNRRDQLVTHVREAYEMKKERKSSFLGDMQQWRSKVPVEYWESSNRPHNVVDILTAVLSGNQPQYQCIIPGNVVSTVSSRAEKFLAGVWRLNARRQMYDLVRETVFRTVLDGGAAVRVYWAPGYKPRDVVTSPDPDNPEQGEPWAVATYDALTFPIVLDVINIDKVYTLGRGPLGRPFDQLFHVESRTANQVIYEWEGEEGVDLSFLDKTTEDDRERVNQEYVEWWGQKPNGEVWHAIMFMGHWVKQPAVIDYPTIPYVLTTFKSYNRDDPSMARLPFTYPILWATEKEEYLSSRAFRMVDMYANIPPIKRGNSPSNLEGTWGKVLNLSPDERLEFPAWPGNPPDVYRLIEDERAKESEGTFSQAMFGQVSGRMSGYGLSQLVGADTTRTDTPRANLELAFGSIADLIFGLMLRYSPDTHLTVTAQVQNKRVAALLSGNETRSLVTEVFIAPKQMSDQVRLAALGAQLASLPNAPVSNAYILEKFFQVAQPEDEQDRKMAEEVLKDPIVKTLALLQVLKDNNHPMAYIVEQKLQEAMNKSMGGEAPAPPEGIAGVGLGLPQATMGNEPLVPPSGNVVEESGPDRQTLMMGGPTEGMF